MDAVEPHLYTTVIREMIRHENDMTNHRIMWMPGESQTGLRGLWF